MPLNEVEQSPRITIGLGAVIVLFGLLCFAGQANELLKQWVIAPGSSAELGLTPNCRPDELLEENLSLPECELLLSYVQIQLVSSPDWFRPLQLTVSSVGACLALLSMAVGFGFINGTGFWQRLGIPVLSILLLLDGISLIGAGSSGPMLRALYLWPLLLWVFIHLSLLLAVWQILNGDRHARA